MHLVSADALPAEGVSHDPAIRKTVLLRRGVVPQLAQLARAVLAPGDVTTGHAHADLHEVFVVEVGAAVFTIDGTVHRAEAGACVVIEPGEWHTVANAGSTPLVLLYFGVEPPATSPRGR